MRSSVGLSASFALAAQAILIPSTDSIPELATISNIKGLTLVDPTSQILKVDCAGCHFAQKADNDADGSKGITWTKGVDNALVLNISVGTDKSTLELNGVRFYPPVMSLSTEGAVPYIPQVPAAVSMVEIKSTMKAIQETALRLTSWAFQAGSSQTVSESGEELLTIHLQLNALERQPISVPDIAITTLKNLEGELTIMKIETADKEKVLQEECRTWPLLCTWRQFIESKLSHMGAFRPAMLGAKKPCPGMMGHPRPDGKHGWKFPATNMHHGPNSHHDGAGEVDGPEDAEMPHHGRPGWKHHGPPDGKHHHGPPKGHPWHHGPHPHHRHHHGLHRAMHVAGRIMLTVFVPVLLGVAAGMVTYLLGMLIGAVFAAVYVRVRGRRAQYQAVKLEEDDDDETPRNSMEKMIKDEELGQEEPLPVYAEKE